MLEQDPKDYILSSEDLTNSGLLFTGNLSVTTTELSLNVPKDIIQLFTKQAEEEVESFLRINPEGKRNLTPSLILSGLDPVSILVKGKILNFIAAANTQPTKIHYALSYNHNEIYKKYFVYSKERTDRYHNLINVTLEIPESPDRIFKEVYGFDVISTDKDLYWNNETVKITSHIDSSKVVMRHTLNFSNGRELKCDSYDVNFCPEISYNANKNLAKFLEDNFKFYGLTDQELTDNPKTKEQVIEYDYAEKLCNIASDTNSAFFHEVQFILEGIKNQVELGCPIDTGHDKVIFDKKEYRLRFLDHNVFIDVEKDFSIIRKAVRTEMSEDSIPMFIFMDLLRFNKYTIPRFIVSQNYLLRTIIEELKKQN